MGDIEVMVRDAFYEFHGYEVIITERRADMLSVFKFGTDGRLTGKDIQRGQRLTTSDDESWVMKIPYEVAKALVTAFTGIGVKPEAESKTEGKLEATKYHLEDLRKVLQTRGIL